MQLREIIRKLIVEVRHKKVYNQMVKKYTNLPRYVLHDLYTGYDDKFFGQLNRLSWTKKIIEVNPASFEEDTLRRFKEREFGAQNPYQIPRDEERMQIQSQIAAQKTTGDNEPIIVVEQVDGTFFLWEGWHRTMTILKLGDNGEQCEDWDFVKINAWIGSSRK